MKLKILSASLLALGSIGAAQAQDIITTVTNPWAGFYAGANIGGAWNHTCQSWTPGPGITGNPALANAFYKLRGTATYSFSCLIYDGTGFFLGIVACRATKAYYNNGNGFVHIKVL